MAVSVQGGCELAGTKQTELVYGPSAVRDAVQLLACGHQGVRTLNGVVEMSPDTS